VPLVVGGAALTADRIMDAATASWYVGGMRRPLLSPCSAGRSALVESGPAMRDDRERHAGAPGPTTGGAA
jgi:hypothetical protein